MDIAQFRLDFPEFSNTTTYPNSMISYWSLVGEKIVSEDTFGDLYVKAVELVTAHYITMAATNAKAGASGGTPGAGGVINNKRVGNVSIGYDTTNSLIPDGGPWNRTSYGQMFLDLSRLFGAGCLQL